MIKFNGIQVTANEMAKFIVQDKGQTGAEYWQEDDLYDAHLMSEKEKELVQNLVNKHLERVNKLLGITKVWDKFYPN